MSEPFDVFDPFINQQLKFHLSSDDLTRVRRATPPFALVGSPLSLQPIVRVLDVNGTLVDDEAQVISVQLALETPAGVNPPALFGGTSIETALGHARFADVSIGSAARRVRLRASSEGLIDAVSEPFDVVVQSEPIALAIRGAPEGQILQRDAVLQTPDLTVEVVDALDHVVSDAPTTLVHLCIRAIGHVAPCTFGAPNLLASATAFAGYPGGVVAFKSLIISTGACESVGASDGRDLFLEANAEGFNPGRTLPNIHVLPPGTPALLSFQGLLNQDEHMNAPVDVAWLEGAPFETQPSVSVLDSAGSVVSAIKGVVTLSLEMLQLDYTNETNSTTIYAPPSAPPELRLIINTTNVTANATNGTNATNISSLVESASPTAPPFELPPLYALIGGNATSDILDGVALFRDLAIAYRGEHMGIEGPRSGIFRLVARSDGLRLAVSRNFSIVLPTTPHALSFIIQPSEHVPHGEPVKRAPVVAVVGITGMILPVVRPVLLAAILPFGSDGTPASLADAFANPFFGSSFADISFVRIGSSLDGAGLRKYHIPWVEFLAAGELSPLCEH